MSAQKLRFSYELEKSYYSRDWPRQALPYLHFETYLRSWLNPEEVFMGERVLDIGAGECGYTRLIAERFAPTRIVACELFRERLLPVARINGNPCLKFVVGDCFRLPFREDSFDVVFGSLVLSQIPNFQEVALEVKRVLVKGGLYVGIEPNPHHPVHLIRYLLGVHSPNQYLLKPKDLSIFRDSGFEVSFRYFYTKLPWIRSRFLGTCMGITAKRL